MILGEVQTLFYKTGAEKKIPNTVYKVSVQKSNCKANAMAKFELPTSNDVSYCKKIYIPFFCDAN